MMTVQGRRETENDRIDLADARVIRGHVEVPPLPCRADLQRRNVLDVTLPLEKKGNLGWIDIKAKHVAALTGIREEERQPYVAKAYDSD